MTISSGRDPVLTCEICGKPNVKTPQGLRGHKRIIHGLQPNADAQTSVQDPKPPQHKPKEVPMADCPNCQTKEYRINDLVERERQIRQKAEALEKTISDFQAKPKEFPPLLEILRHCEDGSCQAHAKELEPIKEKIVQAAYDNIPPELVAQKAQELGLFPQRIVVRMRDG